MADTVLSETVTSITAGESIAATVNFEDYPASDGWACTYSFAGIDRFSTTLTASVDTFVMAVAYTATEELKPGVYSYTGYVLKGATRTVADSGTFEILANPAIKTENQKMRDALYALLYGRATNDQQTLAINDVQLGYMDADELLKWFTTFEGRVKQDADSAAKANGGADQRMIYSRFAKVTL